MRKLLTCLALLATICTPARAGDDARLAYVIAIEDYEHPIQPIRRTTGAHMIADALTGFGFTVRSWRNLKKREFEAALKEIASESRGAEAAILYVTAFAFRKGSRNVLFPADAAANGRASPFARSVEVEDVVNASGARFLNLIVLDTPDDAREPLNLAAGPGYGAFLKASPPSAPNRLVVYAGVVPEFPVVPGPVGGRSESADAALTFARNFELFLRKGGRTVTEFLRKVSVSVFYDSRGVWFPAVVGGLDRPYILTRKNGLSDMAAWLALHRNPEPEGYERFIRDFPNSIYVPFARRKLNERKAR